jgi:hypothetical protein
MFHAVSSVVYGIIENTHNIHSQLYKTYKSWSWYFVLVVHGRFT